MEGHFCEIHQVAFTKKSGKYGEFWSHKLDDGSYCNEPKKVVDVEIKEENEPRDKWEEKAPPATKVKPAFVPRGSPEERSSIESQVAFKGAVELLVGKVIDLKHPLAHTALNYAASKLGNWSSMGLPDNTQALKEQAKDEVYAQVAQINKPVTAAEVIADLKLIIDSKKITNPEVVHILKEEGATGKAIREMVKSLSSEGLAKFATRVKPLVPSKLAQEAVKMGATIEPSELPF